MLGNPKPPYKVQAGTKVLPQEISYADCYNPNKRGTEFLDSSRCDGLWVGDLYRDHSKKAVENGSGREQMAQSLGYAAVNQWCLPSLRRRQVTHILFACLLSHVFFLFIYYSGIKKIGRVYDDNPNDFPAKLDFRQT